MTAVEIKTKLHQQIDNSDEKLLKMMYALIKEYNNETEDADDLRKQLIMEERAQYIAGVGKSYTWQEVKNMAFNKQRP